jgi:polysaccharide biosynthesis protein PslG
MWGPWQRSAKPLCSVAAPLFAFTLVGAAVQVGATAPLSLSPQRDALRQVSAAISLAAAIDTSSNAVGVAESELFYMTPEEVGVAMDTMESMGVTQVRMFVPWYWVEPVEGVYNWENVDKVVDAAEARGIAVLGAVSSTPPWATDSPSPYGAPRNPEDFGAFMGALASRYGAGAGDPETARISAYEIWNEPHAAPFWAPSPDAAAYTEVLKAGYAAVKAVDPSGTVVGGVVYAGQSYGNGYNIGAVDFIEGMYEAGAAGYFDALSYHPYNNDWKFSDGVGSPISAPGILEDIQALMEQNGDGAKVVWTSEYGLPTSDVSEAKQAEFIDDFLDTWSETDGTGPAFLYSLIDLNSDSTFSEDTYGLFRDDWTPKEAAAAVEAWIEENGPLATGELPPVGVPTVPTAPEVETPAEPTPVDPVAEAVANWQKAWAQAVAGWTTAMNQVMNPTQATVAARTAAEPEAVSAVQDDAVTEATTAARAAVSEESEAADAEDATETTSAEPTDPADVIADAIAAARSAAAAATAEAEDATAATSESDDEEAASTTDSTSETDAPTPREVASEAAESDDADADAIADSADSEAGSESDSSSASDSDDDNASTSQESSASDEGGSESSSAGSDSSESDSAGSDSAGSDSSGSDSSGSDSTGSDSSGSDSGSGE